MRGRDSDALMLRSAEANPHITVHAACREPKRPTSLREITPSASMPKRRYLHERSSLPENQLSSRSRSKERPHRRPKAAAWVPQPKLEVFFALRPHPPRWVGVRACQNLTEQPTTRRCSADESVVTNRRCQRPATRSFHGLSFPSKVHTLFASSRRCRTGKHPSDRPKPASVCLCSSSTAASRCGVEPMGSLRLFTLPACCRNNRWNGQRREGRSRISLRRLFSAGARAPDCALTSACDRNRAW